MGAFICQISEKDWLVSRKLGIYGNRINKPDSRQKLREQDRLSVIRDLIGIKEGDLVFFHVIRKGVKSAIHGIYKARLKPFFDETKIWDNNFEVFPHRFLFEPHKDFLEICLYDSFINVSDFYAKIEQRKIWSQATLENERNIERRAVRKISEEDAEQIIKLILRDYSKNGKNKHEINLIEKTRTSQDLKKKISSVGNIENAIKALLMYELREQTEFTRETFGNVIDFMNEVFVAQTTRKLFDILVISKNDSGRNYFIIEAKTDRFNATELTQLLGYLDLFRQREIFNMKKDKITGCILAKRFDNDVKNFISLYNQLGVFEEIKIIQYNPKDNYKDAEFKVLEDDKVINVKTSNDVSIMKLNHKIDYNSITEKQIFDLPIFRPIPNINRSIIKKDESEKYYVIQEDLVKPDRKLEEKIGYVLLYISNNKIDWSILQKFMSKLKEFIENTDEKDYMEARPIILAKEVADKVLDFIYLYNTHQKRKKIQIYLTKF